MNVPMLKGKLVEKGINVETLARELGIDRATLYRKLSDNGDDLTIWEANKTVAYLGLSVDEANKIFFADTVA